MLDTSRRHLLRGGIILVAAILIATKLLTPASAGFILGKAGGGGVGVWILTTGFWNDTGTWVDSATWID